MTKADAGSASASAAASSARVSGPPQHRKRRPPAGQRQRRRLRPVAERPQPCVLFRRPDDGQPDTAARNRVGSDRAGGAGPDRPEHPAPRRCAAPGPVSGSAGRSRDQSSPSGTRPNSIAARAWPRPSRPSSASMAATAGTAAAASSAASAATHTRIAASSAAPCPSGRMRQPPVRAHQGLPHPPGTEAEAMQRPAGQIVGSGHAPLRRLSWTAPPPCAIAAA